MNKILIAVASDDHYLLGTLITLFSLQKNFKSFDQCDLKLYFKPGTLSSSSKMALNEVFPQLSFEAFWDTRFDDIKTRKHLRSGLLKLAMFRETEYRQILFCDSDLLCLQDFSELFELPHSLMLKKWSPENPTCRESIMSVYEGEHNTGVMIVQNEYVNGQHFDAIMKSINFDQFYVSSDQTLLSDFFQGRPVYNLSVFYNFKHYRNLPEFDKCQEQIKILHWAEDQKPWRKKSSEFNACDFLWRQSFEELQSQYPLFSLPSSLKMTF